MNIIGEIEGKICILPDDIIDTAGTICNAAKALKDAGAMSVYAFITHPVLSGPALERIMILSKAGPESTGWVIKA